MISKYLIHGSQLSQIMDSSNILENIKKFCPNVHKLLKYNPEGTLQYLQAEGALQLAQISPNINQNQKGNDNFKTWSDYKDTLFRYLKELTHDSELLKNAREDIAWVLYNKHYELFPLWPSVEEKFQKDHVTIDHAGQYNIDNQKWVFYSIVGTVFFTDHRPSVNEFKTTIEGKPIFKLIIFDFPKMKELNDEGYEHNKQIVDKQVKKALTFDFF